MKKIIRITTVPLSLDKLLEGQLKYMSNYYKVIAVSANKEELEKVGKKEGVDIFEVNLTRKITPLKDLKAVYKLYKFLKIQKPFIVHTHTPKAGLVGMLASYFAKVPNRLHTVAGMPLTVATGVKRIILNLVEKLTYFSATKVYPNSKGLQDIILENKFTTSRKLKIIGNGSSNGINTEYFNPYLFLEEQKLELKQQLNISKEDFVFIFVGRLVGDKGINELISAFNKLSKETENIKLLLVGAQEEELDPLKEKTLEIIKKNKDIISVGFQKDVRPYFAISEALAFPSYREGFPNVVMQAGAMELPSIVSNINGCNEIIINNFNGKIIPVKQEEPLYDEMKYFKSNPEYVLRLKENARKRIIENFAREALWSNLLQEYKSLEKE